jgi:hypothetical protein
MDFPEVILDRVVDHLIPHHWNVLEANSDFLKLRLVCSKIMFHTSATKGPF